MEEGGDEFGNIHHRPTTDTEHRVGFELLCLVKDALEVGHRGFAQDLCFDKNLDTIGSKSFDVRLQNWYDRVGREEQEMVEAHLEKWSRHPEPNSILLGCFSMIGSMGMGW